VRWNARYSGDFVPSFEPHPLAVRAVELGLGDGPVADLACGASGSALYLAASGHRVVAVDVSDVALGLLGEQARRRGLQTLISAVQADLSAWRHGPGPGFALVLCTGFWDAGVFGAAAAAVAAGGLIAWEAFTEQARQDRPELPPAWCLRDGEPASLLPADFTVIEQRDVARSRRRLLARRAQ
jgi:cyclopropane fatty-acyl-phospholipid synthase-like methyltransferase